MGYSKVFIFLQDESYVAIHGAEADMTLFRKSVVYPQKPPQKAYNGKNNNKNNRNNNHSGEKEGDLCIG